MSEPRSPSAMHTHAFGPRGREDCACGATPESVAVNAPGRKAAKLRLLTRELIRLAELAEARIGDDGQILGWRGFHVELDEMSGILDSLKVEARQ